MFRAHHDDIAVMGECLHELVRGSERDDAKALCGAFFAAEFMHVLIKAHTKG